MSDVLDEDKLVAKLTVAHHVGDLLQHAFAGFIERMRFPGEHELHRTLGIVHQRGQPFNISQNQICSLVGRKAAGKPDGERVRIRMRESRCRLSGVSSLRSA